MVIQAQVRRRAEMMKRAPVLIEHPVGTFDFDVKPRNFPGFSAFPIVIGQRDDFAVVGVAVCRVCCLVHVKMTFLE
jgi:hypothetical protein